MRKQQINGSNVVHQENHSPTSTAKSARRSNGINGDSAPILQTEDAVTKESCKGPDADDPDAMDTGGSAPGTPSPEPVPTLIHGTSIQVQTDKLLDLSPASIVLPLEAHQFTMHTLWNPQYPNILAAGGEALCRLWDIPKGSILSSPRPNQYDILFPSDDSLVSAMAWSPDGEILAVATRNAATAWAGTVSLWTKDGKAIEELPATQEMVFLLRFNPIGTQLLGLTASGEGHSSIVVWDINDAEAAPPCRVDSELRDAQWINNELFVVCGKGIFATSHYPSPNQIALVTLEIEEILQKTWTHVVHDVYTNCSIIAAEENGTVMCINSSDGCRWVDDPHSDQITGLLLQSGSTSDDMRYIVTSCLTGLTLVSHADSGKTIHRLALDESPPPLAISLAPKASAHPNLVAAAHPNRILVWDAAYGGPPRARWLGGPTKSPMPKRALPNGNTINGSTAGNEMALDQDSALGDDEDRIECSVSWNADGQKIAMGLGASVSRDVTA